MPTRRLPAVEGLRAIAALTVLCYHVASVTAHTPGDLWLAQLKAGVAVFFVISGFVLYLPHARALADGRPRPAAIPYLRRRAARILPAYWVVLAGWTLLLVLSGAVSHIYGPLSGWWRYPLLLQSYGSRSLIGGLGVAWSLCVEVAFYLALPLLAAGLAALCRDAGTRRSPFTVQLTALAAIALSSIMVRTHLSAGVTSPVAEGNVLLATSLPLLLDWFALGMAVAVLTSGAEVHRLPRQLSVLFACRPGVLVTLSAALFAAATPIQGGDYFLPADSPGAHTLIGLASAVLLLAAVAPPIEGQRSAVRAILSGGVATWLGTVSYGIYLLHVPVLLAARALLDGVPVEQQLSPVGTGSTLLLLVVSLAVTVPLARGSWVVLERPAMRRLGGGGAARRIRATAARPAAPVAPVPLAGPPPQGGQAVL